MGPTDLNWKLGKVTQNSSTIFSICLMQKTIGQVNRIVVKIRRNGINFSRGGLLPRHDEDLREPLVRRQGSQVSCAWRGGARPGSRVTGGD